MARRGRRTAEKVSNAPGLRVRLGRALLDEVEQRAEIEERTVAEIVRIYLRRALAAFPPQPAS